jgi:hypothetical protein
MILRTIAGAMIALAIAASPALACKGPEIFADEFTDDSGPWDNTNFATIGGGQAELKMQPGYMGVLRYLGDLPKEFDVCVDITTPPAKNPDGGTLGGLAFWFKDYENAYFVGTTPIGAVGSFRVTKGRALVASPFRRQNALKAGAGSKNNLRITAKGNTITVYANDQRVASFRGVPEDGYIGLYAESSQQEDSNPWQFSNFKLSEAPN